MDSNKVDVAQCLPLELDKYVQRTICRILERCSCQEQWELKLAEAVDSQRLMQNQIHVLLRRLEEADEKCAKTMKESALNAQALRRQVAETQRLAAEYKTVVQECEAMAQECVRLEKECSLYHNDREVFMEAADEAEDRAAEAEDRADEANRRVEELLQELENIRRCTPQKQPLILESVDGDSDVNALRLKLAHMEEEVESLQTEIEASRSSANIEIDEVSKLVKQQNTHLEKSLTTANQRYEETLTELKRVQEDFAMMQTKNNDEKTVSTMVSSAISAGMFRALEQDRDEAISSLNLQFKAILKRMQGEFRASRERLLRKWTEGEGGRERMKVTEKGVKALLLEAHALRQEITICKSNLDKAQEQVQLLVDENKELRMLLRAKCNSCLGYMESPLVSRGVRFITTLHAWHKCPQPWGVYSPRVLFSPFASLLLSLLV